MSKVGRNVPCPCGSGLKIKHCCKSRVGAPILPLQSQPTSLNNDLPGKFQQAVYYHQSGRFPEAESGYRKVIHADPGNFPALNLLGTLLCQKEQYQEAAEILEKAQQINSRDPALFTNLGIAYMNLGLLNRSEEAYRRALTLQPNLAEAHCNLGNILKFLNRQDEALAAYRRAIALKPDFIQGHENLGILLQEMELFEEASASYKRALDLFPNHSSTQVRRSKIFKVIGDCLQRTGKNTEAVENYQASLALESGTAQLLLNMASAYLNQNDQDSAAIYYRLAIAADPGYVDAHSGLLMAQLYAFPTTSQELFDLARQFAARFETPLRNQWHNGGQLALAGNRLRVGLVSADLRHHSVGYFLEGVLRYLKRESLFLVAYANHPVEDSLSERVKPCFDAWVGVSDLSDDLLADRIRTDGIELLIDLSGHSNGNRLQTFARKPAPVQATWLGYPNTSGLDAMDFILADQITLPLEEEKFYSEKVWRMPETYICFTPPDLDIPLAGQPALTVGQITFGCFNNPAKINDTVIACWADILRSVPDAQLLLKYRNFGHGAEQELFRQRFSACGVEPSRICFAGAAARENHFRTYNRVDIALDPFPYTGVTTTCEALWMGVPTLTLSMPRGMFGHNGELIMKSVGLDDWVADSIEEYCAKAVAFAADPEGLASLRSGLRQTLLDSPLCAAERFADNLEAAFHGMVRMAADSHPPEEVLR